MNPRFREPCLLLLQNKAAQECAVAFTPDKAKVVRSKRKVNERATPDSHRGQMEPLLILTAPDSDRMSWFWGLA